MSPRCLGVIPARGGSQRVPGKNIKPLCGKPLIAWTIEAAAKAWEALHGLFVVTTDDPEIGRISADHGATVHLREEMDALHSSDKACLDALKWLSALRSLSCRRDSEDSYDIVVCLHPTSPIRDPRHIVQAVSILAASDAPSLASVEYAKRSYRHNAAIYAVKVPFTALYGDKTIPFLMDKRHSLDIDDEVDFAIAETLLRA